MSDSKPRQAMAAQAPGEKPDRQLDARGDLCPIPASLTARALKLMRPGEVLEVLADDPLAELDLAVLCERLGHEAIGVERDGDALRMLIRVSSEQPSGAD